MELRSATFGGKVCQFCRLVFDTNLDKMVHATLNHVGETPLKFRLCPCAMRVFIGYPCPECGTVV